MPDGLRSTPTTHASARPDLDDDVTDAGAARRLYDDDGRVEHVPAQQQRGRARHRLGVGLGSPVLEGKSAIGTSGQGRVGSDEATTAADADHDLGHGRRLELSPGPPPRH